jgi:hypothetical protein
MRQAVLLLKFICASQGRDLDHSTGPGVQNRSKDEHQVPCQQEGLLFDLPSAAT